MSTTDKPGQVIVHKARIQARVYRAKDGLRWRIESSARGRRIISESSEAYVRKSDAFRGLLLSTGGTYRCSMWSRYPDGVYEQGEIQRRTAHGSVESIFVEYLSSGEFR